MKRALAIIALGLAAGCGGAEPPPTGDVFIALPTSFAGYREFTRFEVADSGQGGDVHVSGPRQLFINQMPSAGSTSFPVGTIIVKVVDNLESSFAMVKRGGGYNKNGANGWEWFELKDLPSGGVAFVWRGITPPIGEHYSGTSGGACNDCHAAAQGNDFVRSAPLNLGAIR